ncbi:uncharacterized protein LOC103522587 [Diaphorina citri]|uniref:Uncharacterized protein LOC103522585 n=1 Tax=Diaphorina citri TaxID=121845 RepID=A0A1S3DQC7_DIACI|nr:uncharacterized protein LOC103522585 [Diaphorina citri]XP_008485908.1 uncharacterized protein LOC103522586 [Diaphorina citri]XP_008485909.1 uncharacterized protein LOC103522587 [Diaphorina citri]
MTPNILASDELLLCDSEENRHYRPNVSVKNKENNQYRFATWNVRGMNQLGKTENIVNEMRNMKIDILGISETFLKNSGDYISALPDNEKYRVIHSGGEKSRQGVGFILNERTMNMVETSISISERVIALRIKAQPVDLFIVECYAPTSDASDDDIESFYESMRKVIKMKKSKEALILAGDLNAKVGSERREDIVGPYGIGIINERGEEFINFCRENDLIITNTWFEQKMSSRHTWISPNGNVKNKIDYICINRRYRNAITNSKSRPGADCGSDHVPVVINLKMKLKKIKKKSTKVKWDFQKCKQASTKEQFSSVFMEELNKYTNENNEQQNNNDKWIDCKKALLQAAETQIGKARSTSKKKWMTQEILDEMEIRKRLKSNSLLGEEQMKKYKDVKAKIQRLCRKAKDDFLNSECKEAEELEDKNSNKFHAKIKSLTKTDNKVSEFILGENGEELYEGEDMLARWKQYCEKLYQDSERPVLEQRELEKSDIPEFTKEDIKRILNGLSNNKANNKPNLPFLKNNPGNNKRKNHKIN